MISVPVLSARRLLALALVILTATCLSASGSQAQQRRQRAVPVPAPERPLPKPAEPSTGPPQPRESVQADISTRRVAVTSSFSGTEIVVFGAVDNSRQQSPEAGMYDVVVVVAGSPSHLTARKKDRIGGIWLNTDWLTFESVPSYYAIVSTRPIDEIASEEVRKSTGIGFEHVAMPVSKTSGERSAAEIKEFRDAVVRLKRRQKLYSSDEFGVAFIGRSLFRATVDVPANVTVGSFETRVYLFREGELLSQYNARLNLEREGVEDFLHAFAFRYPLYYGFLTVLLAIGAGLLASTIARRGAH